MKIMKTAFWTSAALIGLALVVAAPATADQVILDDLIVDGSICVGLDCVNGESFGFDTLRLKENNLRIKAQDTSNSASFPTNDWQITFNDSSNGGANKFSIDDIDGGRTPFTIEAGARSNALYVDDGGRIGIGTNTPVANLHVKTGNTPTLRLEQDGSSGFTAQTWDVAGNEANFFIRDATNGSTLPFRIFPGAGSNALTVDGNSDVGIGTNTPDARLEIERADGTAQMRIKETAAAAARFMLVLDNTASGAASQTIMQFKRDAGQTWNFKASSGGFAIDDPSQNGTANEMLLESSGRVTFQGAVRANNGAATLPDYVFEPDYELMSLDELESFVTVNRHLPNVPSRGDVEAAGGFVDMSDMQYKLLEKVEELVLYTFQQQDTIDALLSRLESLEARPE